MKIEGVNKTIETFGKVDVGEAFFANEVIYIRIEANCNYTDRRGHDGLAANLFTGAVTFFENSEEVIILRDAKVIY